MLSESTEAYTGRRGKREALASHVWLLGGGGGGGGGGVPPPYTHPTLWSDGDMNAPVHVLYSKQLTLLGYVSVRACV